MIQIKESFYSKDDILAVWGISNFETRTLSSNKGKVINQFKGKNGWYDYLPDQTYVVITTEEKCIPISNREMEEYRSQF